MTGGQGADKPRMTIPNPAEATITRTEVAP